MSLIENTLFGEIDKVKIAIERLRLFEPPEGYYLAFSGGKDSQVIYELAKMSGVKFDAHFSVTTVDPPELLRFIRDNYPDVKWEKPEKTMWKLIVKNGPPCRIKRYCCRYLKERGGVDRIVITGIRKEESTKRAGRKMIENCLKHETKKIFNLIIDWKEEEVWEFIKKENLSHCRLYDEGFKRIGCVGCPMGNRERDFKLWPNFEKAYLRAFNKMLKYRWSKGLKTEWQTPEEVMKWWLDDRKHKGDPDQTVLFE